MKPEQFRYLAGLIAAHPDRKVYGRTRLQKTVYLLQRLGFPTTYSYSLFFYGPYSEGVFSTAQMLTSNGWVREEQEEVQGGKVRYVLRANEGVELPDVGKFRPVIEQLAANDSVTLELAATYDAFREMGYDHQQAAVMLREKKGPKCDNGNETRALDLLRNLGLLSA